MASNQLATTRTQGPCSTSARCPGMGRSRGPLLAGRRVAVRVLAQQRDDEGAQEEGPSSLSEEFAGYARRLDPAKFTRVAQHLDLLLSVSQASGILRQPPPQPASPRPAALQRSRPYPPVLDAQRGRPRPCECCRGSGERECAWCNGVGVLTLGETLFCSDQGCSSCPVCRGTVRASAAPLLPSATLSPRCA